MQFSQYQFKKRNPLIFFGARVVDRDHYLLLVPSILGRLIFAVFIGVGSYSFINYYESEPIPTVLFGGIMILVGLWGQIGQGKVIFNRRTGYVTFFRPWVPWSKERTVTLPLKIIACFLVTRKRGKNAVKIGSQVSNSYCELDAVIRDTNERILLARFSSRHFAQRVEKLLAHYVRVPTNYEDLSKIGLKEIYVTMRNSGNFHAEQHSSER